MNINEGTSEFCSPSWALVRFGERHVRDLDQLHACILRWGVANYCVLIDWLIEIDLIARFHSLSMDNFRCIAVLGRGHFGKVNLLLCTSYS